MKKYMLLVTLLLMPSRQQAMVYEGMPRKQLTFFAKIANGICPAGAEKVGALFVAGIIALPGIVLNSYANSTYCDIPDSVSNGLIGGSVVAGLYGAYKAYNRLEQSTEESLDQQKNIVMNKLSLIIKSDQDTQETIAERVQFLFYIKNSETWLVESHMYVKDLIESLTSLDQKFTALGKPFIKPFVYEYYKEKLNHTLLCIQSHALFESQKRNYLLNKWSAKAGRLAWWATKKTATGAVKVSWFAAKTVVKTSLKLSLLMLKNAIKSIPVPSVF